jgi:hypothetical protein
MKKLLIPIALAAVVGLAWYRRCRGIGVAPSGDAVPAQPDAAEAIVHDASQDSFPASDPRSYWARELAVGDVEA